METDGTLEELTADTAVAHTQAVAHTPAAAHTASPLDKGGLRGVIDATDETSPDPSSVRTGDRSTQPSRDREGAAAVPGAMAHAQRDHAWREVLFL